MSILSHPRQVYASSVPLSVLITVVNDRVSRSLTTVMTYYTPVECVNTKWVMNRYQTKQIEMNFANIVYLYKSVKVCYVLHACERKKQNRRKEENE